MFDCWYMANANDLSTHSSHKPYLFLSVRDLAVIAHESFGSPSIQTNFHRQIWIRKHYWCVKNHRKKIIFDTHRWYKTSFPLFNTVIRSSNPPDVWGGQNEKTCYSIDSSSGSSFSLLRRQVHRLKSFQYCWWYWTLLLHYGLRKLLLKLKELLQTTLTVWASKTIMKQRFGNAFICRIQI